METIIDLRTPSYMYNHGGYYAPGDPRDCNTPGGPCSYCQARIDEEDAAEALLLLAASAPPCCADRPAFLEPCPSCNTAGSYITHAERGIACCNGCSERLCSQCFTGARYYCPLLMLLPPPPGPLVRQEAISPQSPTGMYSPPVVQTPEAEEKRENK
jgi:hypothetical protein